MKPGNELIWNVTWSSTLSGVSPLHIRKWRHWLQRHSEIQGPAQSNFLSKKRHNYTDNEACTAEFSKVRQKTIIYCSWKKLGNAERQNNHQPKNVRVMKHTKHFKKKINVHVIVDFPFRFRVLSPALLVKWRVDLVEFYGDKYFRMCMG